MGNGIPCTQNGLSAWLTHFFTTSQSISNNLGFFFACGSRQPLVSIGFWMKTNRQTWNLLELWLVKSAKSNSTSSLECVVVYQHLKDKAICTFDKIWGFFKSVLILLYHTEMNGNQWLPENVHMVFSWALLVCCFKDAEFCLFRCRSCVFIVYSVRACGSLVGVLVGVLGSCGCPPPGSYKAPRQ